jgi:hypothetical protein
MASSGAEAAPSRHACRYPHRFSTAVVFTLRDDGPAVVAPRQRQVDLVTPLRAMLIRPQSAVGLTAFLAFHNPATEVSTAVNLRLLAGYDFEIFQGRVVSAHRRPSQRTINIFNSCPAHGNPLKNSSKIKGTMPRAFL